MSQQILNECLDLFQRTALPTILPNPKYKNLIANQLERQVMVKAGLNERMEDHSNIGRACLYGDYRLFLILIKVQNITNFNTFFEGESLWSLMHFVMFGRKKILLSNPSITMKELNHQCNHLKIAKYLIDGGLYIDIQSKWGYSSLHECIMNCPDLEFAEFLLKNGADPNIKTIFGETPLHNAVMSSSIESIKLLCNYGADPRIKSTFFGITALYLARTHIEAATILNNKKRKLESNENKLECEDVSYCSVCNISSKITKLYKCSKCLDYNTKYCSIQCQKNDYKSHKRCCKTNSRKINVNNTKHGLVFNVISAQGQISPEDPLKTVSHEKLTEFFREQRFPGHDLTEKHRKKYQKKRIKKMNKELKKKVNKKNKIIFNEKFIIKVQTPTSPNKKVLMNKLLVYNKNRTYMVFIQRNKQKKQYNTLSNMVKEFSPVHERGCKAYFYAWIDAKYKLHVLIDKVLALQPW